MKNLKTEQLIDAIIIGDQPQVIALLGQKTDPNATLDCASVTPLHFAAQNNRVDIAKLLIQAGAKTDAQTEPDGETPLDIAKIHEHQRMISLLAADDSN